MRAALRALAVSIACLFLAAAPARAIDVRTAAQEGSSPKFVAINVNGKSAVGGLCVDIMRAVERVDPDIRFVGDQEWVPFIRIESRLVHGEVDAICGIIRTPEREAVHDFIDTPLFPVEYLLTVRANDAVHVRDWADVRALGEQGVVLSLHGFSGILSHMRSVGGLRIDAGGRDTKVNLEKLLAGRGRFFVHRTPGVHGDIGRSGLQDKVRVLPTVMYAEVFYLMVARSMPPDLKNKINRALVRLAGNGELARMARQWSERPDDRR